MSLTPDQMAEIEYVRSHLLVTKVVATRSVKTKHGDFFVGMSSAWNSIQEDAGREGADLIDAMGEGEQALSFRQNGMSLQQAKIAGLILGLQVDTQALTHALCGGSISSEEYDGALKGVRRNYALKLSETVPTKSDKSDSEVTG